MKGRETDLFSMSREEYKNASPEQRKYAWLQYNARKGFRDKKQSGNKYGGY